VKSLAVLAPLIALAFALALGGGAPAAAEVYTHVGPTPPPHGYPAINAVSLSSSEIRAGRPVHGSVETSENVHYVEVRIDYRNIPMHEDAPGKFSLSYTPPWWLPPWLRRAYTLQIIARSIDGVETSRAIPITVR
jgi:hypothetical protein